MDEPTSISGWKECFARGKGFDGHSLHVSHVNEACKENDGERGTVVFDELSNVSLKKIAFAYDATAIAEAKDQQRQHNCDKCRGFAREVPLAGEHLDAFLEVDECNVEAKGVTREPCHVGQAIAGIGDG